MSRIQEVEVFFSDVQKLKVLVVGETIIDEFITVRSEGNSMKSACPVLKIYGEKERQQGGASIIAAHLSNFVDKVDLITNVNDEIIKTRYIESFNQKKHVEINKFDTSSFGDLHIQSDKYDIVIVADFGHGFCDKITIKDDFYLMCQTNSNNYGHNRISKWKKYKKKAICIDKREAALQINKAIENFTDPLVKELYNYELNTKTLFLTIGEDGSIYFDGSNIIKQECIKSQIVDSIGAGDTFFAFSCLTDFLKYKDPLFIPSLAASLSTTWRCNAQSVNKEKLINHANKYL